MAEPLTSAEGADAFCERRQQVFELAASAASPYAASGPPAPYCGLAMSGGGIRSATFSLGVLQALAPCSKTEATGGQIKYADSLLSSVDYLSTVSGGGYTGSFLCSLFLAGRLRSGLKPTSSAPQSESAGPPAVGSPNAVSTREQRAAAEDALRALACEPPGRIHADTPDLIARLTTFPLAWLRENGRYMTPTGTGDLAYDASLALRNWIAVHYVIGTMFVLAFATLALLRHPLLTLIDSAHLPFPAIPNCFMNSGFELWWAPSAYVPIPFFLLWACPTGLAYWWGSRSSVLGVTLAAVGAALVGAALLYVSGRDPLPNRANLCAGFGALVLLSLVWYGGAVVSTALRGLSSSVATRIALTRWLTTGLTVTLGIAVLAMLETLGQSLYLSFANGASPTALFSSLGTAGGLTLLVKRGAGLISAPHTKGWGSRIPLTLIAGAAGLIIIFCIAVIWSFVLAWILWAGEVPTNQVPTGAFYVWLGALALALLTGLFPSFINLSSLQTLYAARLTRAYLGASNGRRIQPVGGENLSAAEPVAGDDVELSDFLGKDKRPNSLAPLHLINVTIGCTVDSAEQLVQRDRKGLPMAVYPAGYWVDGKRYDFAAPGLSDINNTPSVGSWVATSGAAVSTGLGRKTSLGMALLLAAANVRLGTWWNCPGASDVAPATSWYVRVGRFLFRTQAYLKDELQAKFFGLRRDWQHLSDGGHFENTGLYELLRPRHGLGLIFSTDVGADPDYEFSDLANLIRLVRIDFGIELEVDASATFVPQLRDVFGVPEDFRAWSQLRRSAPGTRSGPRPAQTPFSKRAILLKASHPNQEPHCWIVMFKPAVTSDASSDVIEYSLTNPTFPQQSTADQFFDEAQWESYRKLGFANARQVFCSGVLRALQLHTKMRALNIGTAN